MTLNASKDAGSVTIAVSIPSDGAAPTESTTPIEVKAEGDGWCVVTGWAEAKRLDGIAAEADAAVGKVVPLLKNWDFDNAATAIAEAEAKAQELPASDARRVGYESSIQSGREALDSMKKGWVGGRWRVSDEKDPMTDEHNLTIIVQSTGGVPNSIGVEEPATIIFRCKRDKLDVYVSTGAMLDADWRYDSVSGQHRFGSDQAERFSGTASTDRSAVFLRNPREWIGKFLAREADGWTVELPIYNRTPASVRFDLAGAAKGLAAVPADCG